MENSTRSPTLFLKKAIELGLLTLPSNLELELFNIPFVENGVDAFCEHPPKNMIKIAHKYKLNFVIISLSNSVIT
jgi:hypothetical protein